MKKRKYLSIIIAQVAVVICLLMSPDVKALPQTGHAVTCPTCPTFGCMCIGNCLCWANECQCGCYYRSEGDEDVKWGGACNW